MKYMNDQPLYFECDPKFFVEPPTGANVATSLAKDYATFFFGTRPEISKVIFHDPATIVYWSDKTKTIVKCKNEEYDPEKGLAMAISKKFFGNKGCYYEHFKKWLPKQPKQNEEKKNEEKKNEEKKNEESQRLRRCAACKFFNVSPNVYPCKDCKWIHVDRTKDRWMHV